MDDVIQLKDKFYILASSSAADDRTRVLKQGHTFAVLDRHGDARFGEQGLFHHGTRHLSRMELRLEGDRPMLLSSGVVNDNGLLAVDLTNKDVFADRDLRLRRGVIHAFRSLFIWEGTLHQRFRFWNYSQGEATIGFSVKTDSDFMDIFEVRGMQRRQRGEILPVALEEDGAIYGYRGLDGLVRRTRVRFSPPPTRIEKGEIFFETLVPPDCEMAVEMAISCSSEGEFPLVPSYDEAFARAEKSRKDLRAAECDIYTSHEPFNEWVHRSTDDLHMMITHTTHGPYPFAGVPWFSTVFGRDGLITALEYLWINPRIARGVLTYLAANQARETDVARDAEPGKILHETRGGEMALLGEVPFGRYYGSVDSTPLFVLLAGAYYERTGDRAFAESLWPHIEAALRWIDQFGDHDGDGYVEYSRRSSSGLLNQGWKDSNDCIFHANGQLATGPIALCEVQAYVYDAKVRAADLAAALGRHQRAMELRGQAKELQANFERDFWCEDLGTYALALDGDKKPCRVRASNAGHTLFAGIASPERAQRLAQTLFREDSYSGWGIRTVSCREVPYNPMSYHNGSIWPHDNAMIAMGLDRYGMKDQAGTLMAGFFDASASFDNRRLPELFCGFHRRTGQGPTLYPVACSPQAWAAGAVFLLLQSCLGLRLKGAEGRIYFENPYIPDAFSEIHLQNLTVGSGIVDLFLQRRGRDVGVHIARREGPVKIVVTK